jgi:hypothetical protein
MPPLAADVGSIFMQSGAALGPARCNPHRQFAAVAVSIPAQT